MAAPTQADLRWDLESFFPSITDSSYLEAVKQVPANLSGLESQIDALDSSCTADQLRALLDKIESTIRQDNLVQSFTNLTLSTDANNEDAQKAYGALRQYSTQLSKIFNKYAALVGSLDPTLWKNDHRFVNDEFPLDRLHLSAKHLLSHDLETQAADLNEYGGGAWEKLVDDFSSNISAAVNGESHPISAIRGMAYSTDPKLRADAYEAELKAWRENEIPLAAAMNAIKGEGTYHANVRNWPEQLDITLFRSNMDRATLEAMLEAARDAFPDFRRYLKAKAKYMGHANGLPFYDLFAPVGTAGAWTWEQSEDFVEEGFRSFSDKLADFARQSFTNRWHDVYPRKGKRDGAFCAGVTPGVSRMLYNFKESFNGASTLAHELGHAYHNLCLKDRHFLQSRTPMTLAETASIFCETIIKRRALSNCKPEEKLSILEATLQGSCQTVVDITSRYIFESEVIERRKQRALTPDELSDIMHRAQLETYGDGLDPEKLHPYMWAAKPHYYSDRAFYNFPYMFGMLFALGLYRVYEDNPEGFQERYDNLLSRTGMAMAADLTAEFGIDITSKEFWKGSLDVVVDDINEFCTLVGQ
ncbi:MAG: M3 family oligoendopeptidase [Fimbriimonadaceae bacterium]